MLLLPRHQAHFYEGLKIVQCIWACTHTLFLKVHTYVVTTSCVHVILLFTAAHGNLTTYLITYVAQ